MGMATWKAMQKSKNRRKCRYRVPEGYLKGRMKPGENQITRARKKGIEIKNPQGKRLLTRIREVLKERSTNPRKKGRTRFDDVAEAFVKEMEKGTFIHTKEFIDREEGKVPTTVQNPDGSNIKMYVGVPIDGEDAP